MDELYIGLMSGTSLDGIDAVLVNFKNQTPRLLAQHTEPMPPALRRKIAALCTPAENEIERLGQLDRELGEAFAATVQYLLKQANILSADIRAIGSHGQTIRHQPQQEPYPFTLQIADPNTIATRTGICTVADFRRRDIAAGGQGAPLVPAFHEAVFFDKNKKRAIINIGGIANITVLSHPLIGFDTGPGNGLMDAWIALHSPVFFDKNGEWANSGKINKDLLKILLEDSYFKKSFPKSTGREYFNITWLKKYLDSFSPLLPQDVQATLLELTAKTIIDACPACDIFVCGGGAHNRFLMERLQHLAGNRVVSSTEKLGIHPDWVEAMAFAWLAKQTLEKKSGNCIAVTGALQAAVLGGVYY